MTLYISFYPVSNPARLAEYEQCLKKNIENPLISKIFVLNEGANHPLFSHEKIALIDFTQRPTYTDFFKEINKRTGENDINIIANTDIYFDDKIGRLAYVNLNNIALVLSRYELLPNGNYKLFHLPDSHDTWIFKGQVKNVPAHFNLGIRGCDGRLAYELKQAGYQVLNPSFSIKTYHVHQSQERNYELSISNNKVIPGPYLKVYHRNIHNFLQTFSYFLFKRKKYLPYHIVKDGIKVNWLREFFDFINKKLLLFGKKIKRIPGLKKVSYWLYPYKKIKLVESIEPYIKNIKYDNLIAIGSYNWLDENDDFNTFLHTVNAKKNIILEPDDDVFGYYTNINRNNQKVLIYNKIPYEGMYYYFPFKHKFRKYNTVNENYILHLKWNVIHSIESEIQTKELKPINLEKLKSQINGARNLLVVNIVGLISKSLLKGLSNLNLTTIVFVNVFLEREYEKVYKWLTNNNYTISKSDSLTIAIKK